MEEKERGRTKPPPPRARRPALETPPVPRRVLHGQGLDVPSPTTSPTTPPAPEPALLELRPKARLDLVMGG